RGVCWFWSMFTLTTRSLPSYCWANSSSIGAMALHGPHHSAQKSSSTGVSDFSTSCSKASSLTWVIRSLTGKSPWLGGAGTAGEHTMGWPTPQYKDRRHRLHSGAHEAWVGREEGRPWRLVVHSSATPGTIQGRPSKPPSDR